MQEHDGRNTAAAAVCDQHYQLGSLYQRLTKHYRPTTSPAINVAAVFPGILAVLTDLAPFVLIPVTV